MQPFVASPEKEGAPLTMCASCIGVPARTSILVAIWLPTRALKGKAALLR